MAPSHTGRVAVVTGAARGIGQACAVRLARDGAELILLDAVEPSETLELVEAAEGRAVAHVGDVSEPETAVALAASIAGAQGHCDILVNNAGVQPFAPFEEVDFPEWRRTFAINLDSMFLLCRALLPGMRAQGWGRILNMASAVVGLNVTQCVPYLTTKAAVIGLTRALASEVGVDGVTVNAIAPGLVQTPATMDRDAGPGGMAPADEFSMMAEIQAIKRPETTADLVGVMSFLVSEEAGFMTAQTVYVDGGLVRGG